MIDKLLNKFGYYKFEVPKDSRVSKAEVMELLKTYGQAETFLRLLRDLCEQDMRLYFQASNDADRNKLRGAWDRTNYFISMIIKSKQ